MKRKSNYFIYYKVTNMFNLVMRCLIQCSRLFLVYKTVAHDFTSNNAKIFQLATNLHYEIFPRLENRTGICKHHLKFNLC